MLSNYYVYYYLRNKDSKNGKAGTPYYVGKGKDKRITTKHSKGISIPIDKNMIVKIKENLTENAAHLIEITHIKLWGRIDIGTGILHNKTDGGDGSSGLVHTAESKNKMKLIQTEIQNTPEIKMKKSNGQKLYYTDQDNRDKKSIETKNKWESSEYRESHIESFNTIEYKQKRSNIAKSLCQNNEYKTKQKEINNSLEVKMKKSASLKIAQNRKDVKEKKSQAMKAIWAKKKSENNICISKEPK